MLNRDGDILDENSFDILDYIELKKVKYKLNIVEDTLEEKSFDNLHYIKLTNEQFKKTKYIKKIDALKDLINEEGNEFYVFVKDIDNENGIFKICVSNKTKNRNILMDIFSVNSKEFSKNIEYGKFFAKIRNLNFDDVITLDVLLLDLLSVSCEENIESKHFQTGDTCIKSIISNCNDDTSNVWVYSLINKENTHFKRYLGIDGCSIMVFLGEEEASNQEDILSKINKKFYSNTQEEAREFKNKIVDAILLIEQLTDKHEELDNLRLLLFDEMATFKLK